MNVYESYYEDKLHATEKQLLYKIHFLLSKKVLLIKEAKKKTRVSTYFIPLRNMYKNKTIHLVCGVILAMTRNSYMHLVNIPTQTT